MIKDFSHISFDLDGTLVHTKAAYRHELVPRVLAEIGIGAPDHSAIDAFWFGTNRKAIILEQFGADPDRFWDCFRRFDTMEARSRSTEAYPDAIRTISALKEMGKTVSIITGAPTSIADVELAKLTDIEFDHVCSIHGENFPVKPSPDSMRHVLKQVGHEPYQTLYIGNGSEDALFASAAGCGFVGIDRGEYAFEPGAEHRIIRSLEELFGKK